MIALSTGILLIADPFLQDPNFSRTVIFVCDHQEEGTFGFVLNRIYENTLDELIVAASDLKLPVFYGGPVQMDTIHFLHQYPDKITGGVEVTKGIYWGGDFEQAVELLHNNEIDPAKIRFYIGYSGWGEGQLASELENHSWLTAEATRKLVFHANKDEVWKDAIRHLGGEYDMMINFPIDPRLN